MKTMSQRNLTRLEKAIRDRNYQQLREYKIHFSYQIADIKEKGLSETHSNKLKYYHKMLKQINEVLFE